MSLDVPLLCIDTKLGRVRRYIKRWFNRPVEVVGEAVLDGYTPTKAVDYASVEAYRKAGDVA